MSWKRDYADHLDREAFAEEMHQHDLEGDSGPWEVQPNPIRDAANWAFFRARYVEELAKKAAKK